MDFRVVFEFENEKNFAHAFRRKSIFKILRGRIPEIFDQFYSHKIRQKILVQKIYILHMYDSRMSHESKFLKNWLWLIIYDLKVFFKFSKSNIHLFSTRNTMENKKVDNSVFYDREIEMAFETPFVPRGLRWKFCAPGVKLKMNPISDVRMSELVQMGPVL